MASTNKCPSGAKKSQDFVTVVSVGSVSTEDPPLPVPKEDDAAGYVTVLKIGQETHKSDNAVVEEVLVYRLPGERLGFGLKFEGGTKASEFVKRLFIQSCAPDSPASRVRSSWGLLTEGDEVLQIDSMPVKSMTRIDCVRCLKDSNVVIKLLVKHCQLDANGHSKSHEDLPLVVSAEKKRTPPPPPPVPPRKIPRKRDLVHRKNLVAQKSGANGDVNAGDKGNPQSPKSRPKEATRVRRISDGSIGPPDAEVYMDLISQESPYCLSESDDTGSSISTVVDRFNSFPTTTTSSLAGSLPSTPTARQKQIDVNCDLNLFDDKEKLSETYLFDKLVSLEEMESKDEGQECLGRNEKVLTLQPPVHFQDAPLSYANEDMKNVEAILANNHNNNGSNNASAKNNDNNSSGALQIEAENNAKNEIQKVVSSANADDIMIIKPAKPRPPPPPPRAKYAATTIKEANNNDYDAKNENCLDDESLPRLVDFVPKSAKSEDLIRRSGNDNDENCYYKQQDRCDEEQEDNYDDANWDEDPEYYSNSNWVLSCPLATIGEDEEETLQVDIINAEQQRSTPIVVVDDIEKASQQSESAVKRKTSDSEQNEFKAQQHPEPTPRSKLIAAKSADVELMDSPSINSRLPPDGHEFPDYQESKFSPKKDALIPCNSVRDKIAIFSHKSSEFTETDSAVDSKKELTKYVKNALENSGKQGTTVMRPQRSSLDMTTADQSNISARLHTRSQSLIDISSTDCNSGSDRWSQLIEQRRKGLSKLKGLVIPEHPDGDSEAPTIDLPEIISSPETSEIQQILPKISVSNTTQRSSLSRSIISCSLNADNAMPKYSPAFKRKTLQIHSTKSDIEKIDVKSILNKQSKQTSQDDLRLHVNLPLNDAPKSLESITSPTRSDCSFEYTSSSSPEPKPRSKINDLNQNSTKRSTDTKEKPEDDSDNDSALSSSQSSYVSKTSPPASPSLTKDMVDLADSNANCEQQLDQSDLLNPRLLKAQSVEAINRKNILASAKCRSGRDLKVGSPLIQRKFDESDETVIKPTVKTSKEEDSKLDTKKKTTNGFKKETKEASKTTKSFEYRKPPSHNWSSNKLKSQNERNSVKDLRKSFEKISKEPNGAVEVVTNKISTSVRENTSSSSIPVLNRRTSSLPISTTSKLHAPIPKSNKEQPAVKDIIKATLAEWEPETLNPDLVKVVTLCPDFPGGFTGITLAGGADYETKAVTIHKIRNASVAFRDGQLRKGDRILAINGKSMNGVTHAQSISILKLPSPNIVIVAYASDEVVPSPTTKTPVEVPNKAPKELPKDNQSSNQKTTTSVVKLNKDSASGLGFSVEGGKDSPQGDVPLVIKKLFTGGIADKCGQLKVGDELIKINSVDVTSLSRIDAWTLMRKLPHGEVVLKVRR